MMRKKKTKSNPNRNKDGRWSQADFAYVREHYSNLTVDEMAAHLKRNPNTLKKVLNRIIAEDNANGNYKGLLTQSYDLRSRPFYPFIKNQLSREELKFFEANWNAIIGQQFKEDILYTEELQVKDLIMTEIFINRNGEERHRGLKQIEHLEKLRDHFDKTPDEERDQKWESQVMGIDMQLAAYRNAAKANTDEQFKLSMDKQKLTTAIKGDRKERLDKATEASENWTQLLKKLDEQDFREKAVRQNRLLDMAGQKELEKLGKYHTYEDGTVDRPFLTPETVMQEEKENNEEENIN